MLRVEPTDLLKKADCPQRVKTQDQAEGTGDGYVDIEAVTAYRPYHSVELFAGAGGLALGLELAGFEAQALVKIDKYAAETLQTMIDIYEDLGYTVTTHIVRTLDYNVAQKRERVIIVGIRNDIDVEYRLPKPCTYKPVLRDVLQDVPKSLGEKYPEKKRKVLELVPQGGYWRVLPEDIAKTYMGKSFYSGGGRTGMARRMSWDEPCLTLTCSPAQKQTERCHPDETRPFTVREYARIQSFPDTWEFVGSMGQQYKQIGNAVPVER